MRHRGRHGQWTRGIAGGGGTGLFEIEATDGGHGGGAARDTFVFTVFFDPDRAPLNHAIFGPNPAFTGEMIAGEITINPTVLPLIAGTVAVAVG